MVFHDPDPVSTYIKLTLRTWCQDKQNRAAFDRFSAQLINGLSTPFEVMGWEFPKRNHLIERSYECPLENQIFQ